MRTGGAAWRVATVSIAVALSVEVGTGELLELFDAGTLFEPRSWRPKYVPSMIAKILTRTRLIKMAVMNGCAAARLLSGRGRNRPAGLGSC